MCKRYFLCFSVFICYALSVQSQSAVRFLKETQAISAQIAAERTVLRSLFPKTLSAEDSILWIGEMPVPPACNGSSGRIERSPGSSVQDSCFFAFSSVWHAFKVVSMPASLLKKSGKDPLQWSPNPIQTIYLFIDKARPEARFSVSLQKTAESFFSPEPFVFYGDSGTFSFLVISGDSLYAYQPVSGSVKIVSMPSFRAKNQTALLFPSFNENGKLQFSSSRIFSSGDPSLFLEQGEAVRLQVFHALMKGWKINADKKEKKSLVASVMQEAGVIRFESHQVNEDFDEGIMSIFNQSNLSEADRKERFWKLTSETAKAGYKSMLKNPACLSPLMWGRLPGKTREHLLVTTFEPLSAKSQTFVLDIFSKNPAWTMLSEKENAALWQGAGKGRDLNLIWKDLFGQSGDPEKYLSLFPDLLDL